MEGNYSSCLKETSQYLKQGEVWEQTKSSHSAVKKNCKVHRQSWVFIFKFPLCVDIELNFCINLQHGLWSVTMSDKHNLTTGPDPDRFWFMAIVFSIWWASICSDQNSTSESWVSKTLSYIFSLLHSFHWLIMKKNEYSWYVGICKEDVHLFSLYFHWLFSVISFNRNYIVHS